MPDALSKTVPIWCAVINRLLFGEMHESHKLSTPNDVVGESEYAQIVARLDGFVNDVKVRKRDSNVPKYTFLKLTEQNLSLDVCSLRSVLQKPLRPFWVTPDSMSTQVVPCTNYLRIICCTASRRVFGAEMTEHGYIQGAGDDSESWSSGLTPTLFWRHKEQLLAAVEEDFLNLIQDLAATDQNNSVTGVSCVKIGPTSLYIGALSSAAQAEQYDGLVICGGTKPSKSDQGIEEGKRKNILFLHCGDGKLGSRALRSQLPRIPPFIASLPDYNLPPKILFLCQTGKDLSVGVALAVLCLFFDDDRKLCSHLFLQLSAHSSSEP